MGKAHSIADRARAAGLSHKMVQVRLRHGWSKKRAFSEPSLRSDNSISARARRNGIPAGTAKNRYFTLGWTLEDAVSVPVQPVVRLNSLEANRKRRWFQECKTMAEALTGEPMGVKRARKLLRDLRLAGVIPVGRSPNGLVAAAREAGLNPSMVCQRVRIMGWSRERALSTPPLR